MKNLFDADSPVIGFLTKMTDLLILNMLWFIGCLPVVTIGTSTTALYRCIRKYKEDDGIPKGLFWSEYRKNLKQSIALFFVVAATLVILLIDLYFLLYSSMDVGAVDIIIFVILAVAVIPFTGYVFPLQAQFENSISQTLKNAWLISILHLHMSIVVAILNFLPIILLLFFPNLFYRSLILWFFFGGATIAYLNDGFLFPIFRRYVSNVDAERDDPTAVDGKL